MNAWRGKPWVFTRHARNRIRRTNLSPSELENLVAEPLKTRRSGNRASLWQNYNDGWLRVVVVEEGDAIVVVTVIWPAREPPRDAS